MTLSREPKAKSIMANAPSSSDIKRTALSGPIARKHIAGAHSPPRWTLFALFAWLASYLLLLAAIQWMPSHVDFTGQIVFCAGATLLAACLLLGFFRHKSNLLIAFSIPVLGVAMWAGMLVLALSWSGRLVAGTGTS